MTEDSSADRLLQPGAYIPGTASLVAEVDSMLLIIQLDITTEIDT